MKKYLLTFFSIFSISFFVQAQIPNASFETWTNGNPDGWFSNNIPTIATPVTQSPNAHSGSSAARLEISEFSGFPYIPQLWSGETTLGGFPVTEKYGSLTGYYQLSSSGDDGIFITIWMYKGDDYLGAGSLGIQEDAASYSQFTVPIEYDPNNNDIPDSAVVWIIVGGDSAAEGGVVGSFALIDDLAFGGTVDVKEVPGMAPTEFALKQNYPNPFNPSTTIEYSVPVESFVELKIYDIIGNEVATIVNENQSPGIYRADFNAAELSSGIYIARIQAGSFVKSFKMTLMK